jgi:hypothetical protein
VLPPALALVLVGAAALKLLQLLLSHSSPFYEPAVLDAKYYHEWALRIAGGDLLGDGVFYGLPLYPYFLAACYALVGPVVLVPKLAQVALGVATIFLVYRIGERLDTAATGLLAAVLAAFYGPLLFHETLLVPESLAVPLYAAGLYLCCVFLERPSLGAAVRSSVSSSVWRASPRPGPFRSSSASRSRVCFGPVVLAAG